jgi:hypothetical protein
MAAILSILVLAAIALMIGAIFLWRRGGSRKQAGLMLLLAIIMAVNVAIWTLPGQNSPAPLGRELR